jgi:alkaline phosphatase D
VVAMVSSEYDAKYRLNREDSALRWMMESTGTYAQWDDHEVRNDFAGAEPVFATRMAEGNTSFRRYMPLRDDTGDPMQLYRSFQFGTGAEFFLIDDRQYRSAKYTCCTTASESGFVTADDDSTCTGGMSGEAITPTPACTADMDDPGRTILGATQKAWLKNGLLNSTATFKFIINGPPMTELLFLPYDRWEAWIAEREEILDYIEDPNGDLNTSDRIPNVIWLSTDLHALIFSPVSVDVSEAHSVPELISGSIGENTLFRELPPSISSLLMGVPAVITQVSQFDIDRYNAGLITIDPTVAMPTAKFDFYDRTGRVIRTITFTAP